MFGNTEKEKEWFSNWQAQQQKFQQEQQQKQESFMSSVLDEVRKATQKLNTPYSETIYLQTSQVYNFASQGYPYNGIYIDNSLSSLQIAYRGLTYSLAISEGWNQLNLPDGAQVTPNVSASVVLVRSQVQFNPVIGSTDDAASSQLFAGVVNTTGAVQQLSNQACSEVLLQADSANTTYISVGTADSLSINLQPGQSVSLQIANLNLLYLFSSTVGLSLGWVVRS